MAVLQVLRHEAANTTAAATGLTLTEITQRTGMSRPSCEDAVSELVERELVTEVTVNPEVPRPVGRPAKRFRFRSEYGFVLGVDIGIHKVLALCTDLAGGILGSHRVDVSADHSNPERLDATRTALKRAARSASVRLEDVLAIGVGSTGMLDPATGTVIRSPALRRWEGVNLRKELSGIGRGTVLVGNDANVGALAEHWCGVAGDTADVVYILAGHQFSVGILIDGRVREGSHGAAGEIGVLRAARWYEGRDALAAGKPVDDPEFIDDLATGIAASCLVIDPDKVVIGGGLSYAGDILIKPLKQRLDELCLFPIPVQASFLGEQNVALGAVRLALDHLEEEYFGAP
ncbi:ROK family protein [Actinoplanes sp. CA-030573]|uniref:ROK family protein n=1 Tax=Actinoplanes sp. CA-030573 TaxID=3239898 RepID=UPI003D927898